MADYLKIPEVARRLDVSEKTARRYVKAGVLPSTFIGGAYRVTEEDLEEFIHRSEVKPEAPKAERRSPSEPSFNDVLAEERRPSPAFVEAVLAAAERWISAVSSPETRPPKVAGLVDAALDVGELVGNRVDEVPWESLPYEEQRAIVRVIEKTNEVAKHGLRRLQADDEAAEFKRRRDMIRERTREISRRSASA